MKNIVIIGGGSGTYTLLEGLRRLPTHNTTIVSTADDGGSTGKLRLELGVMPPGDLRQCLLGLSYTEESLKELFKYRFEKGSLAGHNVGNIILSALEKVTGSAEKAVEEASKILNVRGQVIPVTKVPTILSATLENGKKIKGEHNIDEPKHKGSLKIKSLSLSPSVSANPAALSAVAGADAIIFGPGDLFTSTLPNVIVKGMKQAFAKSKAKKFFITNIMTKNGQTNGFRTSDFLKVLESYLGTRINCILVNTGKPKATELTRYKKEKAQLVPVDLENMRPGLKVVAVPLISKATYKKSKADKLVRSSIRHDAHKVAKIIYANL